MKKSPLILLGLALASFIFGLVHLFKLRFEAGDNYPPYSSLRADPLGAKALFDSLDPLIPARRHLLPLSKLGEGRGATLLWLGDDVRQLRFLPGEFKDLETFVRTGGRVVIAPLPVLEKPRINLFQARAARRGAAPGGVTNAPPQPGDDPDDLQRISIKDRWNVSFEFAVLSVADDSKPATATAFREESATPQLPGSIRVHSGLYFDQLDSEWQVIYSRNIGADLKRPGNPPAGTNRQAVVIERSMGKGSIVLSADPFAFSNEALRRDREPALLAWFIGSARDVVFDETHLGVKLDSGVATLARKYHLEGFFIALLALAGLFIWKNSTHFMPPYDEQLARERGDQISGKDSAAGFVNLLRRNIRPVDLMKVCLEQWNAHVARSKKPPESRLQAMQKIIDAENALEPRQRDPVRMHRRLSEILSTGFGFRVSGFASKQSTTTGDKEH